MRRMKICPKRAASGARGRSSTSPMRFSPACASAGNGFGIDAQSGERQRRRTSPRRALAHDRCAAIARHGPGAADRVGHRHAAPANPAATAAATDRGSSAASPPNRCAQPVMSSSNAVRRIEPDQRRVAVAPVGDRFEQSRIAPRIGIGRRECRIHRARIGQRHAGVQSPSRAAASFIAVIRSADFTGATTTSGASSGAGRAARDPVGREPPQPHRQIAATKDAS